MRLVTAPDDTRTSMRVHQAPARISGPHETTARTTALARDRIILAYVGVGCVALVIANLVVMALR